MISLKPVLLARDFGANITDINFMIFVLIFVENCLKYDAINDFSVWLRTGFNPADINQNRLKDCIIPYNTFTLNNMMDK